MEGKDKPITYAESGVNISGGDEVAKKIVEMMKRTHDDRVIPNPMGFAALVHAPENINLSVAIGFGQRTKRHFDSVMEEFGEIPKGVYIL